MDYNVSLIKNEKSKFNETKLKEDRNKYLNKNFTDTITNTTEL